MVVLDIAQWWSFGGSVRLAWYSENRVCKWWWNWNEKKQGPSGLPDIESHCSLKVCKVFVVVPHDDWVSRQKLSMPHRHNSVQALEPLASSHIHTKARAKGPYRIFHGSKSYQNQRISARACGSQELANLCPLAPLSGWKGAAPFQLCNKERKQWKSHFSTLTNLFSNNLSNTKHTWSLCSSRKDQDII